MSKYKPHQGRREMARRRGELGWQPKAQEIYRKKWGIPEERK